MRLNTSKERFLSNAKNKQEFLHLISHALVSNGCCCLHAAGDADTLIVKSAVECAGAHRTAAIGEDTDLFVLLCRPVKLISKRILFKSDITSGTSKRCINIKILKNRLSEETCLLLPFIHAINGYDSTSRLFGLGKSVPLRKLVNENFRKQSHLFCTACKTQNDLAEAKEKVLVTLFNGAAGETLDQLRNQRFCARVPSCTTSVQI